MKEIVIGEARTILSGTTLRWFFLSQTRLPVLVEADVIGGEVGQNGAPQFEDIHAAQVLVENLAVGIEQDGVRNRRLPRGVKGRL